MTLQWHSERQEARIWQDFRKAPLTLSKSGTCNAYLLLSRPYLLGTPMTLLYHCNRDQGSNIQICEGHTQVLTLYSAIISYVIGHRWALASYGDHVSCGLNVSPRVPGLET